jgi:hypothetical protein
MPDVERNISISNSYWQKLGALMGKYFPRNDGKNTTSPQQAIRYYGA